MKKCLICYSILLVGFLISVAGSASAQGKIDTLPSSLVIPHDSLPAMITPGVVAITLEQMDSLTSFKFDCEAFEEFTVVYGHSLGECLDKVEERDSTIIQMTVLSDFQSREIVNQKWLVANQDAYIEQIERDLRKEKRKTVLAWITGAVATGFMAAIAFTGN